MKLEEKPKDLSIQSIVDLIGNHIVMDNLPTSETSKKGIGITKINDIEFQIQVILVPKSKPWIPNSGVHQSKTNFLKRLFKW